MRPEETGKRATICLKFPCLELVNFEGFKQFRQSLILLEGAQVNRSPEQKCVHFL